MSERNQNTQSLLTLQSVSYYLCIGSVFIALKLIHRMLDPHALRFLLKPVSWLVDVFSGTQSEYVLNQGYYNASYNIIIDKSCSGFNFWILCFSLMAVQLAWYAKGTRHRFMLLPFLFALCYLLTIWVNASRIMFSISMNKFSQHFESIGTKFVWLHQAEGTLVYLFFLILIYMGMGYLFSLISQKKNIGS